MHSDPIIHIVFRFSSGPMGGGNQFLKALKNGLIEREVYTDEPKMADILIINSHQYVNDLLKIKQGNSSALIIHRLAGPIKLCISSKFDYRDNIVHAVNKTLVDATIFQSAWSKHENHKYGIRKFAYDTIILNAPDPKIFNTYGKKKFIQGHKIKLIAASWSPNPKKGFDIYEWLDKNLDFNKYEMKFVGNSPIKFINIKQIDPLNSVELASELRSNDIYIFASEVEACSNALLEALHCGLPSIVRDKTSNPDVLGEGGLLFNKPEEIPGLIEKIASDYGGYQQRIRAKSLTEVIDSYYAFLSNVWEAKNAGLLKPKSLHWHTHMRLAAILKWWRLMDRLILRNRFSRLILAKSLMR